MTSPSKPTLLERAQAALAQERAERERQDAELAAVAAETEKGRLVEMVRAVCSIEVEPSTIRREVVEGQDGDGFPTDYEEPVVTIDGIDFTLSHAGWGYLAVVRECPKCRQRLAVPFSNLPALASEMESPVSHRRCPANQKGTGSVHPPEPTTEQRVIESLKDLIRQEAVEL